MHYQQGKVSRSAFRAYDIRGIINKDLDEHSFYTIGLGIAYYLGQLGRKDIFIARDARLTSQYLAQALKQGLLDSGIHVVDLGEVATPVMYYATNTQDIDSGLMVTGSHNPADYNGIKMVLAGKTLTEKDITRLYEYIEQKQRLFGEGQEELRSILPAYRERIVSDVALKKPLKVVVDCGNGVAGPEVPQVLRALGCDVIPLYCDIDGRFPNHHPDPTVEANLSDLKQAVLAHQADIGLAFDGDADRLGVITNQGEIIWPDRLMMFYARALLQHHPKATIVFDVKCSSHLAKVIETSGGIARMCPTGHSIVKAVMREEQALLAGEMSGHLFFKDRWYGFDDALYSACRLLEIIAASPLSVDEQFATIPNSINTPEIKIPISDEEKFVFMQQFIQLAQFPEARMITIDGLRVELANGWGLLRASNTTPCLVARFEADDQPGLRQIQALFKEQIQQVNSSLTIPF
ncbi:MAG: phosphomannomutase/phosphoglucomutase [Legionella sp.]|nr:MAG: phosphomannomutase/phosphoglucomutase [Legionella sp.]PJD98384.1 MAG: phosphomannomutase/phosphoglucomutase [Legionella sp.]